MSSKRAFLRRPFQGKAVHAAAYFGPIGFSPACRPVEREGKRAEVLVQLYFHPGRIAGRFQPFGLQVKRRTVIARRDAEGLILRERRAGDGQHLYASLGDPDQQRGVSAYLHLLPEAGGGEGKAHGPGRQVIQLHTKRTGAVGPVFLYHGAGCPDDAGQEDTPDRPHTLLPSIFHKRGKFPEWSFPDPDTG